MFLYISQERTVEATFRYQAGWALWETEIAKEIEGDLGEQPEVACFTSSGSYYNNFMSILRAMCSCKDKWDALAVAFDAEEDGEFVKDVVHYVLEESGYEGSPPFYPMEALSESYGVPRCDGLPGYSTPSLQVMWELETGKSERMGPGVGVSLVREAFTRARLLGMHDLRKRR